MEKIRLAKYFTDCGIMSRRAAESEIASGRITVNKKIASVGEKIDPEKDLIEYQGKIIKPLNDEKICIMLNKPRGIVCTSSDEKHRTCVTELCSDVKLRLYPIGRLDMDSDGMILLTNDGELANILTHPRHGIPKIYSVQIQGKLSDQEIFDLGEPLLLDGKLTMRVATKRLKNLYSSAEESTIVSFKLYEGRNRQIRRMCEAHGVKILRLTRTAIGKLNLGNLSSGKWRKLTKEEINYLKKSN